jgi:hypothetical protein
MAPGDSWIEWMDHGNIDHYHLFNVKYVILPRFIRPPPFLESVPYGNKKISKNFFRLYKVQTEGYCAVLRRCSNHAESMKFDNCLHPLFHDAKPGRGYGRFSVDNVDPSWKYVQSKPPPGNLPPLTLYQMDHRLPKDLPKSRINRTRAGIVLNETISPGSYGCHVYISNDQRKSNPESVFVVIKVNFHPHFRCRINDGEAGVHRIFQVAPGYIAIRFDDNVAVPQESYYNIRCDYEVPLHKRYLAYIPVVCIVILITLRLKLFIF